MTSAPNMTKLAERLEHLRAFPERLWEHSPEVQRTQARVRRLTGALTALATAIPPGQDVRAVVGAALEAALDGQPIDAEELRADVLAAIASTQAADAVRGTIATASLDVRSAAGTTQQAHAHEALAVLHETLTELVGLGRVLIPLTELSGNLAEAGRAGQARALLEEAARIHDDLRDRQMTLTRSGDVHGPDLARKFGIVRDVSTLAPWATRLATGDTGWSDAPDLEEMVLAGGEELFRLVCRADLEPWVPDVPQLQAAAAAMRERIEQARWTADHPHDDVAGLAEDSGVRVTIDGKQPAAAAHVSANAMVRRSA